MGNCNFQSEKQNDSTPAINKNNFQFHYIIGKGGFGKVWKIQLKKNRQLYAMKEMQKARVISKRSVNSVMNERKLLTQLKHPFIVNMQYAFQDRQNLYLIMDLLTGGDLRYHMSRKRFFSEEQAKFFIGCILLGLEYLHTNGTLHRDIKPENLVFDQKGYLRITDFGIARVWNPDNAQDTSGTPGYMAPEVMCRQNHGVAVDYFPLGVIGYQCMFGKRPYLGRNRKQIRDHILAKQVQIKKHEVPQNWSLKAADFINKLLQRKPVNRLGLNGPNQVKSHQWFSDFSWEKLYRKELPSPFVPDNEDNFSKSVTQQNWKQNTQVMRQNTLLLRRQSIQQMFAGYYFDINQGPAQYSLPKKTHANSTTSSQAQTGPMSPQYASGPTTAASTINRNDSKMRSTIKEPASSGSSSMKYRIDKGTYQI